MWFATLAWAVAVSAGLFVLWRYAHDPGERTASPARWPQASRIPRPADRPVLLFFAHPRCPCTRASLRELERLTARLAGQLETRVVFRDWSELADGWRWTDLRGSADAIPGVQVVADPGGVESELFRARTSGLALLYSNTGVLLFQGGITPSRGHEGYNDGVAALEAILQKEAAPVRQTPVFGCPLQIPDSFALRDASR